MNKNRLIWCILLVLLLMTGNVIMVWLIGMLPEVIYQKYGSPLAFGGGILIGYYVATLAIILRIF